MGCSNSVDPRHHAFSRIGTSKTLDETSTVDQCGVITQQEKRFIRKTWIHLSKDIPRYGAEVFSKIFEINPQLKILFSFRDIDGDDLLGNPNFMGHASRFMQAVGAAIDNINDLHSTFAPLLVGLGKQHVNFGGFKAEYFDVFTKAMMFVWEKELGEKFTDCTREAWRKIFEFIMDRMKEGYETAQVCTDKNDTITELKE